MDVVYVLFEGDEDEGVIGVFSTLGAALAAVPGVRWEENTGLIGNWWFAMLRDEDDLVRFYTVQTYTLDPDDLELTP